MGSLGGRGGVVDDGHEGLDHGGGVGVLDDVAAIDDAVCALPDEDFGAAEDFVVGRAAAAADQDGDGAGDFDNAMVFGGVGGGVGFDNVGAEFNGLPDQREDFARVAIDHVAAGFGVGLEDERLDHQRHGVAVAFGFEQGDVLNALVGDLRLVGDLEEVDDDAGGVEAQGLLDGALDHAAEEGAREIFAIDVGHIGAQGEGGFGAARKVLEEGRLTDGELNYVRAGIDERGDGLAHVFNAG